MSTSLPRLQSDPCALPTYLVLNPISRNKGVPGRPPNEDGKIYRDVPSQCRTAPLFGLGLHALTSMLNAFLQDPSTCSVELAAGRVILLPKTLWVNHAQQFRPIVCGEVFAKLAAKLATCRSPMGRSSLLLWICLWQGLPGSLVHC